MSGSGTLSPEVLASIRALFLEECSELLSDLEAGLIALDRGEADPETVNTVFRAVHSIKGGAGTFELDGLVAFAHQFETTLAALRDGRLSPEPRVMRVLLQSADVIADLVRAARDRSPPPPDFGREANEALQALCAESNGIVDYDGLDLEFTPVPVEAPLPQETGPERAWTVRVRPMNELYAKAGEPLLLLRELALLGAAEVELDEADLPPLEQLDPERAYLGWTVCLRTSQPEAAIRDVFAFVYDDCEVLIEPSVAGPAAPRMPSADTPPEPSDTIPAAPAMHAPTPPAQSIRVDLQRIDRLIDLVGELLINHAMLSQQLGEAGYGSLPGAELPLDELHRLMRETQDSVLAIRAQPVKVVLQRMSRLVRELESATGKTVDLVISGENTEVDRTVIERLTDPLTQLVRNSVAHGIEPPERRLAVGKPARGVIRISAEHRAGRILIEVSDDGGGIDRPAVLAKAVQLGLVAPDASLAESDIDHLIFAPGFSTAAEASDLAGRGVGMDVVKSGVEALGGRIALVSRPGEGCTFSLSLPLTLAIMDGMAVEVCGTPLMVPLTSLVEAVRPTPQTLRRIGREGLLLSFRDEHVPVYDLGRLFGYRSEPADPERGVALVVEDGGGRAALLVDELVGQRQVVIRSLEANYRRVEGIASATLQGDGRVALILDVDGILASKGEGSAKGRSNLKGAA